MRVDGMSLDDQRAAEAALDTFYPLWHTDRTCDLPKIIRRMHTALMAAAESYRARAIARDEDAA